MSLYFGDFALDQERRQLLRGETPVPLEAKAYELLALLVARRPRVLSKTQIREVLWPGTVVGETSLPRLVTELRQALGDEAQRPRFIRTAHGFGYAFCGEIREDGRRPAAGAASEPPSPYPGLASFTEGDADRFVGREVEVGALWEKVRRRKLLAVIGASGAGKTSFVRAGVVASCPDGWSAITSTPGTSPLRGLGQALGPELAGDPEALRKLAGFDDPETAFELIVRWRRAHAGALVVVDQFEELFTLNPPEVQIRLAAFVGRLAREGDVHVLLSLRDDFLLRCHEHEALAPVFDELTPLGPLTREGLRRALVEPARPEGYRFDDDALVDEMVEAALGARGALPLAAFAVSRLWEKRDREEKRLTRAAYEEIGGIAGALAQHAEATLDRIGAEREGTVREVFRNLTTAQGTRAVLEREELLSALPDRGQAEEVLARLIDARLMTSYEREEGEGEPSRRRVEIVHESLLTAWPRLVRWQTQDADGAQLRDQLRQAARLWEERGRPEDMLWTGASFREFAVWRERYPGALSALEEGYARAMTARAARQRRRRRGAIAAAIVGLAGGLAVVGALWTRSERAREAAATEARQREAAQLLALGRVRLEDDPTIALAYALASLERADNEPARRFAVEALWKGPPARYVSAPAGALAIAFSPDGRWMAGGWRSGTWLLSQDGGDRREIAAGQKLIGFSGDGLSLVTWTDSGRVHVFSVPGGREVRAFDLGPPESVIADVRGPDLITLPTPQSTSSAVRRVPLVGGEGVDIGRLDWRGLDDFVLQGEWLMELRSGNLLVRPLGALATPPRTIGRHEGAVGIWDDRAGNRVASIGASGEVWIWTLTANTRRPERVLHPPWGHSVSLGRDSSSAWFDPSGRSLVLTTVDDLFLWDLSGIPNGEPIRLSDGIRRTVGAWWSSVSRDWAAYPRADYAVLWPLHFPQARVLRRPGGNRRTVVAFTPDGRHLVSHSGGGEIRVWPLLPEAGLASRVAYTARGLRGEVLDVDPTGNFVVAGQGTDGVAIVPLRGGEPRLVKGDGVHWFARLDREGHRLVAYTDGKPNSQTLHVWDLGTGHRMDLNPRNLQGDCAAGTAMEAMTWGLEFPRDGTLLTDGFGGLRRWDIARGTSEVLRPCDPRSYRGVLDVYHGFVLSRDERLGVRVWSWTDPMAPSIVTVLDLAGGRDRAITHHGNRVSMAALDPTGRTLVTGDQDGLVRVGPVTGEEPHLLYGHTAEVTGITVSPDGKWIASASLDGTIRLWPMPGARPLHTMPYEALLAKLRSLTNLRVAADPAARDGYKLEIGAFPGWAKVPEW